MTFILGLNSFHADSAACLLHDGELVAAAEEERFRRVKHWAGFPARAIQYCLDEAGVGLGDVAHIALNQDPRAHRWRKLGYVITKRPDFALLTDRLRNKSRRAGVHSLLAAAFPEHPFKGTVHHVEHHLAHLASAFLVSPFQRAALASVDGFGDFASAAWGVGEGTDVHLDERVYFPHSLGIFYEAMTQYLGFPHYGDEYKVMGLASYGKPTYLEQMRRIVVLQEDGSFRLDLNFFRHHVEKVDYQWEEGVPGVGELFSGALVELLGQPRRVGVALDQKHKDLARSVQAMYEEALFHLLRALHRRYDSDTLALAGGCAMNSVANGRIYDETPFRKVYVQAAAGDAGGAIGAALVAWQRVEEGDGRALTRGRAMDHAYWGPQFTDDEISRAVHERDAELRSSGCSWTEIASEAELCRIAAESIAAGKVVGWFQGRMEWGPRALGNRSILGDPRRRDMKDILNLKIKRRESFRPFAPSILREAVPQWFDVDDDVPFMMQVYPVRADKRALIPAVTHVDGTGRLQTVTPQSNPRYYRLIEAFASLSGVPMVLNTSFNENEPVVCRPEEALDCFLRTRMDVLVLHNVVVTRAT